MDQDNSPQTTEQTTDEPKETAPAAPDDGSAVDESFKDIRQLAQAACENPQVGAPLRELVPLLVEMLIEQREELDRHAAIIFELGN